MKTFYDHDELVQNISKKIMTHLEYMIDETDLPKNDNSMKRIIESWLLKRAMFDRIIEHGDFIQVKSFGRSNRNACIAITLSGSILAIGPVTGDTRKITYISLNMRNDVPKILTSDNAVISEDIEVDRILTFKEGPIKQTSEILGIGIASDNDDPDKQIKKIIEINKLLMDNFIQINQNTFKSNYFDSELNARNDLFKQWIIIEWFLIGGIDRQIFLARAKLLWLELFTKLYQELSNEKKMADDIDGLFIEFTNNRFAKFIDDYKWFESEKKEFDIGLMKALEEIPGHMNFWDYQNDYVKETSLKYR